MSEQQKKSKPAANWGPGGKRITEFPPGALAAAIKKRRAEEEEIAKLTNPKGIPVIFPGYD